MKFLSALMMMVFCFLTLGAHASVLAGKMETQEYTYDFAVDGGAVGSIDISKKFNLPVGAIIESGYYMVQTAFTSGGSATVALGSAASTGKYLAATAYNNAAYTALTPAAFAIGVPSYVAVANDGKFYLTIATAAVTAGKVKIVLKVYKPTAK